MEDDNKKEGESSKRISLKEAKDRFLEELQSKKIQPSTSRTKNKQTASPKGITIKEAKDRFLEELQLEKIRSTTPKKIKEKIPQKEKIKVSIYFEKDTDKDQRISVPKSEEFLKVDTDINKEISKNSISNNQFNLNKGEQKISNPSKRNYYNLCRGAVDFIKDKIGLRNDNFDTYKKFMKEKGISGDKIFKDILSENTLKLLLRNAEIRDIPDKRKNPLGPSKNRLRAFNCLIVITLILLICYDYECLIKNLRKFKKVSDKQIRNLIKEFVPYLNELNPNYDFKKWLPDSKRLEYSFDKIKQLVKSLGMQTTSKPGILIKPKTKKKFDTLRMELKVKPTLVPIVVKCDECGNIWETNADRLQQKKWCEICSKNIYTFSKTKKLVEEVGIVKTGIKGILRIPKYEEKFDEIKEKLGCWYCRIPLKVECGYCGNIWKTNAERLQQNHWCPKCAEGIYEQICRWYLEKVLSYIFKLKITCPQTRLYKIIKCYNETNYKEYEKKVIENLIKFGHVDCYYEICINGTVLKLALEYQGGQHEKIISKFHNTLKDLRHQKLLDKLKRKLCKENGIVLIEFPYDIDKYMNDNIKIQNFTVQELKNKTNIEIPLNLPLYNHNTPEFGQYRLNHYL